MYVCLLRVIAPAVELFLFKPKLFFCIITQIENLEELLKEKDNQVEMALEDMEKTAFIRDREVFVAIVMIFY